MIFSSRDHTSKKRAGLGKFLQGMGYGAIFFIFLFALIIMIKEKQLEDEWLLLLYMVLPFLGAFLLQYGKRLAAEDATSLLVRDKRPMVLILRAFAVDKKRFFGGAGSELNLEQHLASILSYIGPVVAVGRPHETLAPSGAARLYIQSENWKHEVRQLMDQARIVVLVLFSENLSLQPHEYEGFRWEIQEAMKRLDPQKLLFILPAATQLVLSVASYSFHTSKKSRKKREKSFNAFAEAIRSALPYELPASVQKAQFLYFNAGGRPNTLRTRGKGLLGFCLALRPFFRELGVKPPSVNPLVLLWRFNAAYRTVFMAFIFMMIFLLLLWVKINWLV